MNVRSIFMPTRTRQLYSSLLYPAGCSHGLKTDAMTAVRSRSRFEIRQICFHPEATPRRFPCRQLAYQSSEIPLGHWPKRNDLPRHRVYIGERGGISHRAALPYYKDYP